MLNQKNLEIFLVKIRKSLAKQFLEVALHKNMCEKALIILRKKTMIFLSYLEKNAYLCKDKNHFKIQKEFSYEYIGS